MSTFTLKSIAQRGSLLVAAVGLVAASVAPAVFADALNPLTERSLLLSSSAPGWQDTDGSGYSSTGADGSNNPNPGNNGVIGVPGTTIPETYAPAGSGANGRKTGETFTFRISTPATVGAPIKGFSLQYCTDAAGLCQAPGDNAGDARDGVYDSGSNATGRKTNAQALADKKSDLDVQMGITGKVAVGGTDYKIYLGDGQGTEISSYADWTMAASNLEDTGYGDDLTGKNNYITLTSPTGLTTAAANTKVRIVFLASETKYITNPGSGSFFVKMNTYSSDTSLIGSHNDATPDVTTDHTVIDGGVTVANVMADSIHITTKVLETMSFSVGTANPDATNLMHDGDNDPGTPDVINPNGHGTCDIVSVNNRIELGNQNAEFSLQTDRGYGANSYWRLSSNSSGGASVYYSGETLTNTVGDIINPMPVTKTLSNPGNEQFGLAFDMAGAGNKLIPTADYSASFAAALPIINAGGGTYAPGLNVLDKAAAYADGHGDLGVRGGTPVPPTASFAFDRNSVKVPVVIADNLSTGGVLGCETGKMRYVANIAPDTPAGVYTTKVNYLAAPQY